MLNLGVDCQLIIKGTLLLKELAESGSASSIV